MLSTYSSSDSASKSCHMQHQLIPSPSPSSTTRSTSSPSSPSVPTPLKHELKSYAQAVTTPLQIPPLTIRIITQITSIPSPRPVTLKNHSLPSLSSSRATSSSYTIRIISPISHTLQHTSRSCSFVQKSHSQVSAKPTSHPLPPIANPSTHQISNPASLSDPSLTMNLFILSMFSLGVTFFMHNSLPSRSNSSPSYA